MNEHYCALARLLLDLDDAGIYVNSVGCIEMKRQKVQQFLLRK